jgi:hypothetical protein
LIIFLLFVDFEVIERIVSCGIDGCLGDIVSESTQGPGKVFQIYSVFVLFYFYLIIILVEGLSLVLIEICGIHCGEEDSEMSLSLLISHLVSIASVFSLFFLFFFYFKM